jgi:ATP-dependent DNA ligase
MLATLVDKPFDEPGWLYEIKWDGYRALALCNDGEVNLVSRNNKSFNEKFYPVYNAVKEWGINAVIDGEIAVLTDNGYRTLVRCRTGEVSRWGAGLLCFRPFVARWSRSHAGASDKET